MQADLAHRWLAGPIALTLTLLPGPLLAAAMGIAPMRVDLRPEQRMGVVTVRNNDPEPVMVQVQAFAWPDGSATEALQPTREILAVPPIVTIPPGQQQVVRVALRAKPALKQEAAYRVLISEVPRERADGGNGVRFAVRFSVPVFVTPPGAAPAVSWSLVPGQAGPTLRATNRGTAHLHVRRVKLGGRPAGVAEEAAYILAGGAHDWPLGGGPTLRGPVKLTAETNLGPVEATVAGPGG